MRIHRQRKSKRVTPQCCDIFRRGIGGAFSYMETRYRDERGFETAQFFAKRLRFLQGGLNLVQRNLLRPIREGHKPRVQEIYYVMSVRPASRHVLKDCDRLLQRTDIP